MDVGGTMDPYTHRVNLLFSAANNMSHWKDFKHYYFHNCIYTKDRSIGASARDSATNRRFNGHYLMFFIDGKRSDCYHVCVFLPVDTNNLKDGF